MSYWLTSDWHLWHSNIILYEKRPFVDYIQMNDEIKKRHNEVVKKNDIVINLGDVAFVHKEALKDYMSTINGRNWLIKGNHDNHTDAWYLDVGFEKVFDMPIIFKKFFILSHEPVYLNENMPYVNIHGHLHSQKMQGNHYINVGVENWNYYPVNFDTIRKLVGINENQKYDFPKKDCQKENQ
jgi:calcineurin-like phosphoesterase family protein